MRSQHVPEHVMVMLEPREADTLRTIASDLVSPENRAKFGLNELEEEVLEAFVEALASDK